MNKQAKAREDVEAAEKQRSEAYYKKLEDAKAKAVEQKQKAGNDPQIEPEQAL